MAERNTHSDPKTNSILMLQIPNLARNCCNNIEKSFNNGVNVELPESATSIRGTRPPTPTR
jgi:hypothetical protein